MWWSRNSRPAAAGQRPVREEHAAACASTCVVVCYMETAPKGWAHQGTQRHTGKNQIECQPDPGRHPHKTPTHRDAQRKQESLQSIQTSANRHHLQPKHTVIAASGLLCEIKPRVNPWNTDQNSSPARKPHAPGAHFRYTTHHTYIHTYQWSEDVIKADPFFGRSRVRFRVPPWVSNTIARDHLA